MRFFAKLMLICNCCFLVAAFFHYANMFQAAGDFPQPLNFLKSSIVMLGYFGWIFNIVFVLIATVQLLRKRLAFPKWLYWFNAAVLVLQIYYFFIDRS